MLFLYKDDKVDTFKAVKQNVLKMQFSALFFPPILDFEMTENYRYDLVRPLCCLLKKL